MPHCLKIFFSKKNCPLHAIADVVAEKLGTVFASSSTVSSYVLQLFIMFTSQDYIQNQQAIFVTFVISSSAMNLGSEVDFLCQMAVSRAYPHSLKMNFYLN